MVPHLGPLPSPLPLSLHLYRVLDYCLFVQWNGFSAPRGTESNINALLSSSQTRDDFLGQVDVPLSHLPVRTDSSRLLHAGGGVLGISD